MNEAALKMKEQTFANDEFRERTLNSIECNPIGYDLKRFFFS